MAQLTWRNVDAPDLRTSLEGIRTFNDMLGNAFTGAKQGINEFDAGISKRANQGVLLDIAAAQDSDAAKQLLAGISARPDARRISADTLALGMARPGDLTKQAAGELGLDQAQYTFGRTKDENSNLDAARPALARLLGASGDENAQRQILNDSPELQKLTPAQLFDFAGKGLDQTEGMVNIAGKRINNAGGLLDNEGKGIRNQTDRFGLMVNQRNDADDQAGQNLAMVALRGGGSPEDVRSIIAASNPSAGQFTSAMRYLDSKFPGVYGPITSGEATAGGGLDVMNYEARDSGIKSVPGNIKTMGDASAFADQVNSANKARTGRAGSSAMGPYQIVGNTRDGIAADLFGSNWKSQPYSLQNETKIAAKIFEQNRGSADALRKQWVSLDGPGEAEAVRKMPVAQALAYIAKKESKTNLDPSALLQGSVAARAQLSQRQSQDQKDNITPDWDRIVSSRRTPSEVANDLASGPLKGIENVDQIRYRIEQGMNKSGNNAEAVGEILRRGITTSQSSSGVLEDLGNMFKLQRGSTPSGLKANINNKTVDAQLTALGNGGTLDQVLRGTGRGMLDGQIQAGQQAVAQSQQLLAAARARAASDPAARLTLPQYEAKANQAQAALTAALRQSVASGNKPLNPTTVDAQASRDAGGWLGWLGLKR